MLDRLPREPRLAGLPYHPQHGPASISWPDPSHPATHHTLPHTPQTKMKSVLVDFLVGAGLKPTSIVSYNHLGNNDGMNLSAPATFRSKEISKSNVVDDMVASNRWERV